jgi:hypothetical protein
MRRAAGRTSVARRGRLRSATDARAGRKPVLRFFLSGVDRAFRRVRLGGRMAGTAATVPDTVRYVGVADWWGRHVWVERDGARGALPACGEELIAGFAWGRRGIAARELARAILADATGSPAVAERYCREFTHAVIARFSRTGFELGRATVLAWLERAEAPLAAAAA